MRHLALRWRSRRLGLAPSVRLRHAGELLLLEDRRRSVFLPHPRCTAAFRDGVREGLERTAARYLGDTEYVPREGDVVIDAGAGIGAFTLWCAEAGAKVFAFEPDPAAFACLRRNVAPLAGVTALPLALWRERASLRLHLSSQTLDSSLIEDDRRTARAVDVEAWPLDQIEEVAPVPVIDLLKLSGGGVEPEILSGAARTMRRTRIVVVDVGAAGRRPNLRARVDLMLDGWGFKQVPHGRDDTILAVNTAMVGPFRPR